jgi:dCTP diphosphatase
MNDIENIKLQLRKFALERDWDQFHSPKNLAMALSVEVSEIIEHLQWVTEEESKSLPNSKIKEIELELADTLIYLIRLADKLNIDLIPVTYGKIEINSKKYPVDSSKGNAKKYTEK